MRIETLKRYGMEESLAARFPDPAAREADEAIEKLAHSDFGLTTAQTRPFDCT